MRILALIPARGGSKRIPGKNLRALGGRPLIVWSIDVAKNLPDICDILVSTDSQAIADVAKDAGALVPWLRPDVLATDTASSVDVALHALDWYEQGKGGVDGVLLLQPTSPFRSRQTILRGIELFRQNDGRPTIGLSPAESHPHWCFEVRGSTMQPFLAESGLKLRSQDLVPAYVVNGAFYLLTPEDLRRLHSFHDANSVPLVMNDPIEGIDIDTEWDWELAEALLTNMTKPGSASSSC